MSVSALPGVAPKLAESETAIVPALILIAPVNDEFVPDNVKVPFPCLTKVPFPESVPVIALLPLYKIEHSSLIYMANELIKKTNHPLSGFYLDEWDQLKNTLEDLESKNQKTILLGVSFALLEAIEKFQKIEGLDKTICLIPEDRFRDEIEKGLSSTNIKSRLAFPPLSNGKASLDRDFHINVGITLRQTVCFAVSYTHLTLPTKRIV